MFGEKELVVRWVKCGIVCGLAADLCYGLAIGAPLPRMVANIVFWSFGPLLIVSAPGIYHFIRQHKNSITLQIGCLFLMLAGLTVTMMAVVQRAVFETFIANRPEETDVPAYAAWKMGFESGNAVQLGLDIVWDIFILVATVLIAVTAWSHPRLGKIMAVSGVAIGLAGLFLNFQTFPTPPAAAGSFDIGPLVGIWFLVVVILMIRSFRWLREALDGQAS
ncbi:MAG: hypothetical protein GTN89_12820 [Acidobacteria bacterium]|nr:hypothetical protein [Acidobacteriota bacterium]NIM63887.1 hypothetical protein [Acidobacteriota bacterium]NIO60156.1 hypothetical protein [Acidobacteriota bacterium]NIQ31220.1 hypothetical protein [Acidobacteriota bacterium]NIQ86357.1 hypothetical protein [Acidobacteriota bacterium]